MGIWSNAFKLALPPEVTEEEKALLNALAGKVRRRGMEDIAAMALESTRPLHNLGAQGIVFLGPMLGMIFEKEEVGRYAGLLENPGAVSYLVEQLGAQNKKNPDDSQGEPHVKKRS